MPLVYFVIWPTRKRPERMAHTINVDNRTCKKEVDSRGEIWNQNFDAMAQKCRLRVQTALGTTKLTDRPSQWGVR